MDTAIGTFPTDNQAAFTPTLGEVKPIDVISLERRKIDEKTVTDLVKVLARDGRFLQQIVVREEGATAYRLIAGHHRLEAWKRHFGKLRPIPADNIYPLDAPDALITILEIEENLLRKELTAAERQADTMRLAAALKELDGEKLATELPVSRTKGKSATTGGRGKKAATAKVAIKLRLSKAAVQKRVKAASAAIGEKIDLECDTPEELKRKAAELERKATERQHAEAHVVRLKRRKPEPRVEDTTPPAEPHAGEIDGQIEAWLKAFDTFGETYQFRLAYLVCIRLGLDPFKMAPPAVFGLVDEESELAVGLPAEVAPPPHGAMVAQSEERDDAAELGAEDLQVAEDEAPEDTNAGSDDADGLASEQADNDAAEDADDEASKTADQEAAGATKCAYCNIPFESGDQLEEFNGKLYHGFCVEDGKRLAKAKQGKQVAIAA